MSFVFKWPQFSEEFHRDARAMLENALNKGNKPPIIADRIEVVELEMGTQPPELQIREIGDLTLDQFRGIFRLSYSGDAHIVLKTKVQANPLNHKRPDIHMLGGSRGMLAAHQPLVVPMLLRLSHFVLNGYVVLVVSKQKGITLVFKTDPLQNVDVNSTFDSIAVIQKYIQREIEGQLREMFREDLPGIIHRLSQQWVAGKTKVETPYLSRPPIRPRAMSEQPEVASMPSDPTPGYATSLPGFSSGYATSLPGSRPFLRPVFSRVPSLSSLRTNNPPFSRHTPSIARPPSEVSVTTTPTTPSPPNFQSPTTFPELENFDPTYGLRPDDLPAKSGYSGFGRLFGPPRGLADLAEHPEEDRDWDETGSYDMIDWEETVSLAPPPSVASQESPEYETIPAVGGGTITRPRVYHSLSSIRSPVEVNTPVTERGGSSFGPSSIASLPPPLRRTNFSEIAGPSTTPLLSGFPVRPDVRRGNTMPLMGRAGDWSQATIPIGAGLGAAGLEPSLSIGGGNPEEDCQDNQPGRSTRPARQRSLSTSTMRSADSAGLGSSPNFKYRIDADGHIILRPGLNNTISQLSTLSHSYHTLSPYARSLEHFTVRSVPHRTSSTNPPLDRQPRKAKRKRVYRLGKKPPDEETADLADSLRSSSTSPPPPSEFEASDVEHYFRIPQGSLRHRTSYQTS